MQKKESRGFVRASIGMLIFTVCLGAFVYNFSRQRRVVEQAATTAVPEQKLSLATGTSRKKTPAATVEAAPARTVDPAAMPAVKAIPIPPDKIAERLQSIESFTNALSLEQIDLVSDTMKQLVAGGPASIPAIAAYLDKQQDVPLNSSGLLNFPTLRAGLIDALKQIGGSEAVDEMVKTLQGAADPFEIGLLGTCLEELAPGRYQKEVVDAARESLKMAERGELGNRDVGPIFQALRMSGAPEARAELEGTGSRWNYYSAMALAALPDGSGVSLLVGRVQNPDAQDSTDNRFAWQMVAQVATQNQEAQNALMAQARDGRIPVGAWPKIITALAGDQYRFGDPRLGEPAGVGISGLKTYHINFGNQNYYSLPLSALNPTDLASRQGIIDGLLKYDLPAEVKDQLRQARASLLTLASAR